MRVLVVALACASPGVPAQQPEPVVEPAAAEDGVAEAPAEQQGAEVSGAQGHYEDWVRSKGGDPSTVRACPDGDAGDFRCFEGGYAGRHWASDLGAVTLDGQGDWVGFLQAGTPAEVAARIERMQTDQMAQLQQDPPSVEQDGDVLRFSAVYGFPPGFQPHVLMIEARSGALATVRLTAANQIAADADPIEPLLAKVTSGGTSARSAAEQLGELGDPRAVPALLELLSGDWDQGRLAAAQALGKIGDVAAVEPLEAAVRSETDTWIQGASVTALAAITAPEATEALRRLEADPPTPALGMQITALLVTR